VISAPQNKKVFSFDACGIYDLPYMNENYAHHRLVLSTRFLTNPQTIDLFFPHEYHLEKHRKFPVYLVNDGQDAEALKLRHILAKLNSEGSVTPFITAAIHASQRLREYGTAGHLDYAGRGDLAQHYTDFIIHDLLPHLQTHFRVQANGQHVISGCSLGGLSAFDITWNHPDVFSRVGVFSGSFWWRRHSENDAAAMIDRIMHGIVRESHKREGLRFWFEAGTEDEKEDRNNSGVIDAIEDTLDLMDALADIGYSREHDMLYRQVEGGHHNCQTWSEVMPEFLRWAFGTPVHA
jgi:iron(III)-enterobactin esterase